jgi:hypothetical protein
MVAFAAVFSLLAGNGVARLSLASLTWLLGDRLVRAPQAAVRAEGGDRRPKRAAPRLRGAADESDRHLL